jgi:hypothetical protein
MNIKTSIAVVSLAFIAAVSASADPISGSISFTGGVTLDNNADAGSSSKVLSWTGLNGTGSPTVMSDSGSFATFGVSTGETVSFVQPWMYDSTMKNNFWSVGGFVFNLISSQIVTETPGVGVLVQGTGMITGPAGSGLDSTFGNWTFQANDPSTGSTDNGTPIFTFEGDTTIPDGGMTLILLGSALTGLGLIKRKLTA